MPSGDETPLSSSTYDLLNGSIFIFQRRDEVLSMFSFKADRFVLDQLLMVAFIIGFYTIGYFGLLIRVYRSR
ncbi:unnamed protein product [Cylicostephanus goldi]|uniref:Uncharacterized protein n=1 Tax=Cylicostephanus goldi TaxID=71465 RepID=A0A3P6RB55_CYLGO|nr:unnamed protein product [Cylicostephanus goldi]